MRKILVTILTTLTVISNILPGTLVLEYRNPLTIFTWERGTVLDKDGNGIITSPYVDSYYNYIKYEPDLEVGKEVFSLFIYNPLTLYGDDYIARFDF